MKIPIRIKHITPQFEPKETNGFIVDCDQEGQFVVLETEGYPNKSSMTFEDFNRFYLSDSNLKLGHNEN